MSPTTRLLPTLLAFAASGLAPLRAAAPSTTSGPEPAVRVAATWQETETRKDEAPPVLEPVDLEGVRPLHRVGPIYLGGQPSLDAFQELAGRGVTLVIDLRRPQEERGFDQALLLEELGMRYERLGFGGDVPLTDEIIDRTRTLLAEHTADGEGQALLHCASSNRVGAVWAARRVLDEGVPWATAIEEAKRQGLRSPQYEEIAHHYVLGSGKQELGALKLRIREQHPDVARISVSELERRMAQDGPAPLLIDARSPAEFEVSQIQGARNAPAAADALALLGEGPRDREVVVYCSVGVRSALMANALTQGGFTNVRNLEGSIFEWANTGRPVWRGEERARTVHPFDERWGRLLKAELHPGR